MSDQLTDWHRQGRVVHPAVRGVRREVFVHVAGTGSPVVLLHGFPASSFEWAPVSAALERRHTVVAFDFLGFGASEKPRGHHYSVFEQADLAQEVLAGLGLNTVTLVAYDYGAIVATELLARASLPVDRCVFLNAGLYAEQYRPTRTQRAMLWPGIGPVLARTISRSAFTRSWSECFSPGHPLDPELAGLHYRALRAADPRRDAPARILRYIPERAGNRDRLESVYAGTAVPLSFLWGMEDPISGRRVANEIRRRNPGADLVEYPDLGHCPHIEAPARIAGDILARTAITAGD
ncbi:alpha/beta fold hydrolase [Actinoplanes sp. NPDC049265]|uniref:alpha/beta fold hydrolase n=1 Tax=Actinoplanes sp. NPDC049265 TaxID=3363902 RepID=UPI0037187C19